MSKEVDVAIVGAGAAGLSCGKALRARGLEVVVLERDDGVGGRVRTDEVDGYQLDRGFQVLPTAYPEARALLDLDRLDLHRFASGAIVRHEGRFRRLADPRRMPLRAVRGLADGVVRPRDVGAGLALLRDGKETTVADALDRAHLSETVRSAFLVPFLRGITLDPALTTSSRFLSFVLRTFAGGPGALPARGMRAIPEQLAEGLDVRVRSAVAAVGPGTVSLADGGQVRASAVVVATAGLLDDAGWGWQGVCCTYFAAPSPPLPGPWLVLAGADDGPVNNLCVPTEVAPSYGPPGRSLVSVTTLGEADPDAVDAQLRRWFGASVGRWSRLTTVSVPNALPRWPAGVEPSRDPRVASGLYACGDHREHPSLNGALASGRRAAEAVLADLGVTALLLVHAGATVALAGLVWFVQLVHYPLFALVGRDGFTHYEADHARRTTWLVAPLMLAEAATALVVLAAVPSALTVVGAALLGVVWLSTVLVQVPLHGLLERGFDADAHRRLVRSNAVRTAAWTGRAVLALALLA